LRYHLWGLCSSDKPALFPNGFDRCFVTIGCGENGGSKNSGSLFSNFCFILFDKVQDYIYGFITVDQYALGKPAFEFFVCGIDLIGSFFHLTPRLSMTV
jgi:hypothetical protein